MSCASFLSWFLVTKGFFTFLRKVFELFSFSSDLVKIFLYSTSPCRTGFKFHHEMVTEQSCSHVLKHCTFWRRAVKVYLPHPKSNVRTGCSGEVPPWEEPFCIQVCSSFIPSGVMVSPRGAPRARLTDMAPPGPLLPPYGVVVGVLLRLVVYLVAVLYR